MRPNRIFCVFCVAVAALTGCSGGQAETATAARAAEPQATEAAVVKDNTEGSAARTAVNGAIKAAITMHAQASIPAIECGFSAAAELEKSKAEVRKLARNDGVDDATFDQLYAAGERKSRTRWEAAPASKRASACDEWKTMTEQAQAYGNTQTP